MGTAKSISTTGGGSNWDEYIIHQIEMAVKCLGIGAMQVRYNVCADQEWAEIAYADERCARLSFAPCMPFTATVADEDGRSAYLPIESDFFGNLIADIIRFFETGETSFSAQETLEVMKIRKAVIKAKARTEWWWNI